MKKDVYIEEKQMTLLEVQESFLKQGKTDIKILELFLKASLSELNSNRGFLWINTHQDFSELDLFTYIATNQFNIFQRVSPNIEYNFFYQREIYHENIAFEFIFEKRDSTKISWVFENFIALPFLQNEKIIGGIFIELPQKPEEINFDYFQDLKTMLFFTGTTILQNFLLKKKKKIQKHNYDNIQYFFHQTDRLTFLLDKDFNLVSFNEKALLEIKKQTGKIIGRGDNLLKYLNNKQTDKVLRAFERIKSGDILVLKGEDSIDPKWSEITYFPIMKNSHFPQFWILSAIIKVETEKHLNEERILRQEAQVLSEELRSSEEELRQTLDQTLELYEEIQGHTQRLSAITEAVPDMIFLVDERETVIENYPPESKLFNEIFKQVNHKNLKEIFTESFYKNTIESFKKSLEQKVVQEVEATFKWRNSTYWFESRIAPLGKTSRESKSAVWIIRDVTQEKLEEERVNIIFESTPVAFILVDESGIISMINKRTEAMFGYTKEELIGSSVEKLIPKRFEKHPELVQRYVKNPHFREMASDREVYAIKKDGEEVPVIIGLNFLKVGNEKLILSSITDISESKARARELKSLTEDLIQRNRDLEKFAYITSHNLRAPVANILGLTNIYDRKKPENPFNETVIEHLEKSADSLDTVIRDLNYVLDIKHNLHLEIETVNLETVLKQSEEALKSHILKHKATIKVDFSKAPEIKAVSSYMFGILKHLIGNAIRFKKPEKAPHIEIKSYKEGDIFCLVVSDNGLGIDLNRHKEHVFGLYKRFHANLGGKGLGLHLVKTQVEAMGGKIDVRSEVGKGTTFEIFL